jgi:oligopeptide transport system permease protein
MTQSAVLYHPPITIWNAFSRNKTALGSICLLGLIILFSLVIPVLSPRGFDEINLSQKNLPPSAEYWFGTDDLGRDLFVRVWYGARISLCVGVAAASLDIFVGIIWGGVAALSGGFLDELLMRTADILYALPYLLVVILIILVLGSGLISIIVGLSVTGWIPMARILRAHLLQLKKQQFILAAEAMGASFWRILFKHLLPNSKGQILVTLTLTIPSAIFGEAFLSFLGLGIPPPAASWGTLASEGMSALGYYPWRFIFPGALISVTMLAFYLVCEGLREAFECCNNRR